jgi:hypothetical protein
MITKELQKQIIEALAQRRENFEGSDARFSVAMGINNAQYSRIKRGDTDRVLSDAAWISLARRLNVSPAGAPAWKAAQTPVWLSVTAQLEACQMGSLSAILCDAAGIGKTYTAVKYAETHKHVAYIDCSRHKDKNDFVREIARCYGLGHTSRYRDVFEDLVFYLKTIPAPLVIFDEAGDLNYSAFIEIKALWNATEHACGYYMMGADGLAARIQRSIDCKKVGYTEIFSRFGNRYTKVIPPEKQDGDRLLMQNAAIIIRENIQLFTKRYGDTPDINRIIRQSIGDDGRPSLRRIFTEACKNNL